ncbi:ABC transporter ATP-binding protein [Pedobacter agri]|uniref:ABC transporter ATP-binding protein n=1 Tax=Pedobacter agri TaxID=454586 RepID=UPI0027817A30|nr:ABC transporter ATP-binding protein [Pedobacter agri]MDQ1141889.1 lipopolysaccharide transport system ATP-binding protein [Pedobacter agri]
MSISIKVENLSKAYRLGQIGTGTISRDLERWYARMRGKEDPFLRIGESNDQYTKSESDVVWSLKDINFEIEQGDAVGIIGRNGAGKSTLLKILSKVTAPTTGKISGKGRIASLLEVGTGFHPELSGRENIFLNGAILGMRKKEIQHKLEEIVDFAGIERYLDTPVKRYSSGMYVRLAFAVAAHLESEILIVDEVLAVGDAEFQKKCLGKMSDVSKGEGRTVLFVSHNMGSIKQLCSKGLVLVNGELTLNSDMTSAVAYYHNAISQTASLNFKGTLSNQLTILDVKINDKSGLNTDFAPSEDINIEIIYQLKEKLNDVVAIVSIFNEGIRLFTKRSITIRNPKVGTTYKTSFKIEKFLLRPSTYTLSIGAWGNNESLWIWGTDILSFRIDQIWSADFRKSDEGIFNLDISTNTYTS